MTRAWLLIFATAAGAAGCLWFVLSGQYASGTVYPDYSSQRTDRMGTAALYEALSRTVPKVSRNEAPLQSIAARDSELLILGLSPNEIDSDFIDEVEAQAKAGNRVVVAFDAGTWVFNLEKINQALWSHWNLHIADPRKIEAGENYAARVREFLRFESKPGSSEWKTGATHEGKTIAVSRQFGTGSVVLVGGSWAFTNAALREDRNTEEIAWAVGTPSKILFDETHLGSVEQGSVMGLVRRFRLEGVLAAAIACALLFIWQSSSPFPPERAPAESDTHLAAASARDCSIFSDITYPPAAS